MLAVVNLVFFLVLLGPALSIPSTNTSESFTQETGRFLSLVPLDKLNDYDSTFCCQVGNLLDVIPLLGSLGLSFLALYLVSQNTTTTATSGRFIRALQDYEEVQPTMVGDVVRAASGYIESAAKKSDCAEYELCQMGRWTDRLISHAAIPRIPGPLLDNLKHRGFLTPSVVAVLTGFQAADCKSLYPNCENFPQTNEIGKN